MPSKGRAKPTNLLKSLLGDSSGRQWFYVVEPQEQIDYSRVVPAHRLLVLPDSGRGIVYVRNWIKQYAGSGAFDWYWMLDDDITSFYAVVNGKNIKTTIDNALDGAEKIIRKHSGVGQAALEYQQFAWSSNKAYKFNGYCDVCVLNKTGVNCSYRADVPLKEDRDYTLQVLSSGYRTIRICSFAFSCPKNGSNAGGLKPLYDTQGVEETSSKRMVELWPGVCTFNRKKDGRPDVAINWRFFKN